MTWRFAMGGGELLFRPRSPLPADPGATEEDCVPVLERVSGLRMNEDFSVGYSPERINPGDKLHTVTKIK